MNTLQFHYAHFPDEDEDDMDSVLDTYLPPAFSQALRAIRDHPSPRNIRCLTILGGDLAVSDIGRSTKDVGVGELVSMGKLEQPAPMAAICDPTSTLSSVPRYF